MNRNIAHSSPPRDGFRNTAAATAEPPEPSPATNEQPAEREPFRRELGEYQIDTARQRRGHWEYRVIWEGYPDSTWETDVTLSTAGEQVQAMIREARNRAEGEQKGTRKAARTRKAGVNVFTALEPSLGSNPIFRMRQEVFGSNELEDCGCAYLPLYFYGTF
eukprot:638363-Pleurochrysis_carterae.AAC.2